VTDRDELRRPLACAVEKILDEAMRAIEDAEARCRREAERRIGLATVLGYWFGHLRFFVREDGQDAARWLLQGVEDHLDLAYLNDAEWNALANGLGLGADDAPLIVDLPRARW
jgi:hypothetical protein